MALSANSVFEVQTGGTDTNGGGFVTGAAGTDYSLVAAKRTATGTDDSTTDAVANGTTTITSATANFGTSIVGNIISLSGGTGVLTQTWRQVTARTNATTITVDATVAAGTGITMNIGGALKTLGGVGLVPLVLGNKVWFKAGAYTITSASNNVANGCFSKSVAVKLEGYNATRGDMGTAPVFTASGITAFTMIAMTAVSMVVNMSFDGATLATGRGISIGGGMVYKCTGTRFTNRFIIGTFGTATNCSATACTTQFAYDGVSCYGCVATTCTATPFNISANCFADRCIAYSNTGGSTFGIRVGLNAVITNCVAYANGAQGFFSINTADGSTFINCIAESNTAEGFWIDNTGSILVNCATFGNSAAFSMGTSNIATNIGNITGTGSFFTNAAAGDFSLNNTAGRGAALRATALPTPSFPLGLTANYLDVGAAQHQDTGGSGSSAHSSVF